MTRKTLWFFRCWHLFDCICPRLGKSFCDDERSTKKKQVLFLEAKRSVRPCDLEGAKRTIPGMSLHQRRNGLSSLQTVKNPPPARVSNNRTSTMDAVFSRFDQHPFQLSDSRGKNRDRRFFAGTSSHPNRSQKQNSRR